MMDAVNLCRILNYATGSGYYNLETIKDVDIKTIDYIGLIVQWQKSQ